LRFETLLLAELPANLDFIKLETAIGLRFLTPPTVLIRDFDRDLATLLNNSTGYLDLLSYLDMIASRAFSASPNLFSRS
jgi:hypothetical protein